MEGVITFFSSVIWSNTVKLLRYLSLLQFLCSIWCVIVSICGFLFVFFCWVSGIQLRSVVEDAKKPYSVWTRSLLVLLYFSCLILVFLENRQHVHSHSWCTKTLFTSYYRTDDIDGINNAIQQWKTMGKIPARGFITRLYSATVPTVSTYIVKSEKKYVNRVKLTA